MKPLIDYLCDSFATVILIAVGLAFIIGGLSGAFITCLVLK